MTRWITQRFAPGPVALHFLLMGALALLLSGGLQSEPRPQLGPPDPSRLALLTESYAGTMGRLPDSTARAQLINLELRDELLFREALELRLDLNDPLIDQRLVRNLRFLFPDSTATERELVMQGRELQMQLTDEVIRRRLIQLMEQRILRNTALPEITDKDVQVAYREAYEEGADYLRTPASISFRHVYLGEAAAVTVTATLDRILSEGLAPPTAVKLGKPFLTGFEVSEVSWPQVEGRFGPVFADSLQSVLENNPDLVGWLPPFHSVFGVHLVHMDRYQQERLKTFDEARETVRWSLIQAQQNTALEAGIAALMGKYEVRRL